MKTENSYQKLQNEDTLSTISFQPPTPPPRNNFFWRGLIKFSLFCALLLVVGNLLVLYGFRCEKSHKFSDFAVWSRFYELRFVPKHVISKESCPLLATGFESEGYEDSVEIRMHRMLTRGKLQKEYKDSVAMKMVKNAYDSCRTGMENLSFVNEMIDTVEKEILKDKSGKSVAEAVAFLQSSFGLETFFNFRILANFQEPDGDHPYLVYLSPNSELTKISDYKFVAEKVLNLRGQRLQNPTMSFIFELQDLISDSYSDNSSYWEVVDLKTLDPEKSFFDFRSYFKTLLKDSPTLDLDTVKFVLTDPDYFEDLADLVSKTDLKTIKSFFLSSLKKSVLEDFEDCMHAIEKYVPHAATVIYLSTFKDGEIRSVREKFLRKFENLIQETEKIILKYLDSEEQRKLAKERLQKVGLTTEEPDWLQLDDSPTRFEQKHKNLQIRENSSGLVALLRLRRFAFIKSISHLGDKSEALRTLAFENSPMSETKMSYSRIGNWIQIPVASFMDFDEEKIIIRLSAQISKILDSEGFKWSPFGTQRSGSIYSTEKIVPRSVLGQEQCFRVHGLEDEDFSLAVGLEAAYRVLLKDSKNPFSSKNLPLEIARKVAADRSFVKMTIASGFLDHIQAFDKCPQGQHLPCFFKSDL